MAGGGTIYGRGALILRVGACRLRTARRAFECHTAANLGVTRRIWVILTAIIVIKHPPIGLVLTGPHTVRSDAYYTKTLDFS